MSLFDDDDEVALSSWEGVACSDGRCTDDDDESTARGSFDDLVW